MIRRELNENGQPAWGLIAQQEHARLAGDLATAWSKDEALAPPSRPTVVLAAYHHDDGWQEWDDQPRVDDDGCPYQFSEMPLASALGIWHRSIERAAERDPGVAWLTSAHFSALLERFGHWRGHDEDEPLARDFLSAQQLVRDRWLIDWQAREPDLTPRSAAAALGWLQWFDAASLWFCCHELAPPLTDPPPGWPQLTWTHRQPLQVVVDPWPLDSALVKLRVAASVVPAGHYRSADALAAAPHTPRTLEWQVEPAR